MAKLTIFKKISASILAVGIVFLLNGCVYSNNKGLNKMSDKEKQEVFQSLDEVREELKEDFSEDDADFALEIVDRVEQALTEATEK